MRLLLNEKKLARVRNPFRPVVLAAFLFLTATSVFAQDASSDRPIPILTGNAGYFTTVDRGETALVPEFHPVLLLPLGDRWLVEARAGFEGEFEREEESGPYKGKIEKEIDYAQVDYIANRYVTITAGRFLTPFGIYNERLYPIWIRNLHQVPLVYGLESGSSDGAMLRGGFALNAKVNLNYAAFFSALSTTNKLESDRATGGRVGLFFPKHRLELGGSWQKELQEERTNAFGFHFVWQPGALPLSLRTEYVRSHNGSGYWTEAAYRFSQVQFWHPVMKRTEFVARMQQFFVGEGDPDEVDEYGLPHGNVRQPDFGLNFYLKDGLKAQASYGRWLGSSNWNTWTFGIAYRFAIPLGPTGAR